MTKISDDHYPRYYARTPQSRYRRSATAGATDRYAVERAESLPDAVGGVWEFYQASVVYQHEQQLIDDGYSRVYPEVALYDKNRRS